MYEYLKSLEKDSIEFVTEAAIEQFEIDKLAIENEYQMSMKMYDISSKEVTESEDSDAIDVKEIPVSKREKFAKSVSSMLKASSAAIGKTLDHLSNKISGEDSRNINDYLSSKVGEIRMEQDIKKMQEDVKKAAREADQLVQAIAKGTHISDEKVDAFVSKTKEIVENNTETILTAAAAAGVYATQVTIYDDMKKKSGQDGIFQQCKTMEGQSKVNRVLNAVINMNHKESRVFSVFMNKYDSLERKKNK